LGTDSAKTTKPRKNLRGWDTFLTVGFVQGRKKIRFFFGREFHEGFVVVTKQQFRRTRRDWQVGGIGVPSSRMPSR